MSENYLTTLRRFRKSNNGDLKRGAPPSHIEPEEFDRLGKDLAAGTLVGIATAIVVAIALYIHPFYFAGAGILYAMGHGIIVGLWAMLLYFCWPIASIAIFVFTKFDWPNEEFVQKFGPAQKLVSFCFLGFLLTLGINHAYPYVITMIKYGNMQIAHLPPKPFKTSLFAFVWFIATIGLAWVLGGSWRVPGRFNGAEEDEASQEDEGTEETANCGLKKPFSLWLGTSTGKLASLSHGASIARDQEITLTLADAAQNILILGAIGSGKTTSAMHPLLTQLLDQDCGGLIFDIKGDFHNAVINLAESANREITIIGVNHCKMNLLAGLTPEVASSFLKSIFTLSANNPTDSFWLDTAVELCRNALGVLSFVPKLYSLSGLYSYLFDLEARVAIDDKLNEIQPKLTAKKQRLLNSYWQYYEKIFDKFDDKVKSGVNATIAKVLAPFNHPELVDAFCTESKKNVVMEDVLNGTVYLVEMPLSIWGLGGKVVYTLIKLRFFNVMQKRLTQSDWNQERPVFFMCDEFQEIVSANKDGISDLNFWDKSRSSKTIGIISAQAVSSFYAAIGDRDTANALLQNFRQKICFKTEDTTTLSYFHSLADKVEVVRKIHGSTSGSTTQSMSFGSSDTSSRTESITYADKPVINAQLFRSLNPQQALALLSIGGKSMDDVINTFAIFI